MPTKYVTLCQLLVKVYTQYLVGATSGCDISQAGACSYRGKEGTQLILLESSFVVERWKFDPPSLKLWRDKCLLAYGEFEVRRSVLSILWPFEPWTRRRRASREPWTAEPLNRWTLNRWTSLLHRNRCKEAPFQVRFCAFPLLLTFHLNQCLNKKWSMPVIMPAWNFRKTSISAYCY